MCWAVNGIGLSLVIPNGQSLIADYYEDHDRGKAFGTLYLTGAVGAMIGTLYATNVSALPTRPLENQRPKNVVVLQAQNSVYNLTRNQ